MSCGALRVPVTSPSVGGRSLTNSPARGLAELLPAASYIDSFVMSATPEPAPSPPPVGASAANPDTPVGAAGGSSPPPADQGDSSPPSPPRGNREQGPFAGMFTDFGIAQRSTLSRTADDGTRPPGGLTPNTSPNADFWQNTADQRCPSPLRPADLEDYSPSPVIRTVGCQCSQPTRDSPTASHPGERPNCPRWGVARPHPTGAQTP